jgi:hypothetical protein
MVTKRTGRPRGRPKRKLLDDPDRYRLALTVATMAVFNVDFESAARLALGAEGKPISPDKAKLLLTGRKRREAGWALQSFKRINSAQEIDSKIDSLRLKRQRFDDDEAAQRWLYNMRGAWINLLECGPAAELLVFKCCEAAGESRYAEDFRLPMLRNLAATRAI